MNRFSFICMILLLNTNYAHACLQKDTIPIASNIQELINFDSKKVMFRTNNIRFQFVNRHLDTSDYQTRNILDSILNKKDLDEVRAVLRKAYQGDTRILSDGKYYYHENGMDFDFRNIIDPNIWNT